MEQDKSIVPDINKNKSLLPNDILFVY